MASYWWQCSLCKNQQDFPTSSNSRGLTHYIWDVLVPSSWDQSHLLRACSSCSLNTMRITYIFPRADRTQIQVKHIIGLGPFGEYLPMMWETIPDGNETETWIDFKYINGRSIWGLNKPAVFSKEDMRKLFQLYRTRVGDNSFP